MTNAIHEKNGKILIQLFHAGRSTSKVFTGGLDLWSSSAIAIKGINKFSNLEYTVPKEMTQDDIKKLIEEFRQAAENSKLAGFDGVVVHGANSYILD